VALEAPAQPPDAGTAEVPSVVGGSGSIATRPKTTRVVSADITVRARLREIWLSRELLNYLIRTEIKVKYKNSFLGLLWSMVSPALTLAVYTMVFGVFLHNGFPDFVIYLFAGLLLWNFFSTGVLTSTGVIVNNAGLVKKVSFPREILAIAAIGSAGVFFFFQALVMVLFMLILHWAPAWSLLYLVLVAMVPTLVLACALGILLAAVNVYMRDTQHLVTVLVGSAWFWACPIVYSFQSTVAVRLAQHHLTWLYFVNPLTILVMTFQRALYARLTVRSTNPTHAELHVLPHWSTLTYVWGDALVLAGALLLFYVAMVVFGRLAGNFAEEL
jgi:ABC-2 type transport system permease protein